MLKRAKNRILPSIDFFYVKNISKWDHKRLCSVSAREDLLTTLPNLRYRFINNLYFRSQNQSTNMYNDETSSVDMTSSKSISRIAPKKKNSWNLSYLESINASRVKALSTSKTDGDFCENDPSQAYSMRDNSRRSSMHNKSTCLPSSETNLPIINEYKMSNSTMREENNKSLFKSMRELQENQIMAKKPKKLSPIKFKEKVIQKPRGKSKAEVTKI